MDAKYQFQRLPGGTVEIRGADGSAIPDDISAEAFLDFLHWNSVQKPIAYPDVCRLEQFYFFNNVTAVVDHFKRFASLISAQLTDIANSTRQIKRGTSIAVTTGRTQPFYILEKVIPYPTHPDLLITGFGGLETSGFSSVNSGVAVTRETLDRLNDELINEESDVRSVSSWSVSRCFVYLDVSDFSKMPAGHQLLVINSIVRAVQYSGYWEAPAARDAKGESASSNLHRRRLHLRASRPMEGGFFRGLSRESDREPCGQRQTASHLSLSDGCSRRHGI